MARFAQLLNEQRNCIPVCFSLTGISAFRLLSLFSPFVCKRRRHFDFLFFFCVFCFQKFDGHLRHISNCAFRPSIVHLSTIFMVEDNTFKIRDGVKWNLKWHVKRWDGKILSRDVIQHFMSSISASVYGLDKIHLTIIQLFATAALFFFFYSKNKNVSLDSHLEFISIFYFGVCVWYYRCSWKFLLCRLKMKRKSDTF